MAKVSGIDLTFTKETYIKGRPKAEETRSPTDGIKPRSASKKYLSAHFVIVLISQNDLDSFNP